MTMNTYTILTVRRIHENGMIDGGWLQDHIGTLETAKQRADATSALNSNTDIAVVEGVSFGGPCERRVAR